MLEYANATHLLHCRHCIGPHCRDYYLRCHILKTMPDGRLKVLVCGTIWKGQDHVQRVRYVEANRVRARRAAE